MRKRTGLGIAVAALAFGAWVATAPHRVSPTLLAQGTEGGTPFVGDAVAGEIVFAATGCASCHNADGTDALAGGEAFVTDFGTFYAPNISTHPQEGVGGWTDADLIDAILAGVSPDGAHYYPAFPYASYNKMQTQDVIDLIAYLKTLPADATPSRDHDLKFPFNIRRTTGVWKFFYMTDDWAVAGDLPPDVERGRYLVEATGHCAECHTPRNALGGLQRDQWMRGAANPSGEGRIPSIHPDDLGWSAQDIAIYLDSGFTPDFDTVGGEMVDVVENTSQLTDDDRAAIAAYLVALP